MADWDRVADVAEAARLEESPRELLRGIQEDRLRRQIARIWEDNAFYRDIWTKANVDPSGIRGLADIVKLPLVRKEEFEQDATDNPPMGRYQGPYPLARVHASSGTTGDPKPFAATREDWSNIGRLWSRRLSNEGVRGGDVVQIAFTFSLFIPGFSAVEGVQRLGATAVPTGSGAVTRSLRQLQIATRFHSTVLGCTGSYALHLAEVAEAQGYDPRSDFFFRRMFHTGEPLPDVTRRAISERWGCPAFDNYGSVETGAPTFQCETHHGFHIMEDAYLFEVVDPVTHTPLAPGEDGAVVVTSLFKQAAPVVRYWTGDGGRLVSDPCACGRTSARLVGVHRLDDMIKVRGVTVYPEALEGLLSQQFPEVADYRVVLTTESGLDVLTIEVETSRQEAPGLEASLSRSIRARLGVEPKVAVWPGGGSPWGGVRENAVKIRRVEDRRQG